MIANSLGQTTQYNYDCSSQFLLSVTDYNGQTTSYSYESPPLARPPRTRTLLSTITNPDGAEQDFSYDSQGRLSAISMNHGAEATHYNYANFGAVTATDANGHSTIYDFNKLGLLANSSIRSMTRRPMPTTVLAISSR